DDSRQERGIRRIANLRGVSIDLRRRTAAAELSRPIRAPTPDRRIASYCTGMIIAGRDRNHIVEVSGCTHGREHSSWHWIVREVGASIAELSGAAITPAPDKASLVVANTTQVGAQGQVNRTCADP